MRWALVLLATTATWPARAQETEQTGFRVERAANAESCPDTDALARAVGSVRGRSGAAELRAYRVVFSRSDDGFHVSVESLRDASSRALSDGASTCDALAHATAVTLALLLDADADDTRDSTALSAPTRTAPDHANIAPPPARAPRSAADSGASPNAFTLHAGGGLLLAAVRPVAPLVMGGAGVELRSFSANVGVAWAPPGELRLAPGEVATSFLGITLESCLSLATPRPLRLDACSGLLAGLVQAKASGFTRNDARSRAWLAIPIGLGASASAGDTFALRLQASLLLPVRRQEFRVDGIGIAYESPPVAALLTLRATTRFLF